MTCFRYVVDEYCTARRAIVVRSFLDALTVGGPYGTPRPMELHAHDPPRYVGDMLAWLHQMTPTEKENIQVLLKGCHKLGIFFQSPYSSSWRHVFLHDATAFIMREIV